MPPIGETLREARMRQQLDIADVEERTKIRAKYLRALENEEWGLLPGPTFVKTFLRTYAELLGVDAHLLVEEYRANHEPGEDYDFQPLAPVPPRENRRGGRRQSAPRPSNRGAIVAILTVAVLAFFLLLGLLGGDDGNDPGDERAGGGATTTSDEPAQRTGAGPKQTSPESKRPAGVRVRIAPTEPTYACVDTGPGTPILLEETLESPRTFRDGRLVRLNLGRRSIELTVNGKPMPVAESGEPLGLAVRPGGAREIPEAERPCV
jgi:transcriptional regulator with XRE-family HTH domain